MKKFMVVLYKEQTEIGALGMQELLNLPAYKEKTVKDLVQEMNQKNLSVKVEYRKIS